MMTTRIPSATTSPRAVFTRHARSKSAVARFIVCHPRRISAFAAALACLLLLALPAKSQQTQQLAFAGLRSIAQQGQINAVKTDPTGNLYLLVDQHDGIRLLKTDPTATTLLAQTQLGAAGDAGLAMALDPVGNLYVTGTSTGTLTATPGAAIPNRTDASTQSFVAKFTPALTSVFVTFTGGSKIAATAIAATADAVFVTGITYGANLPVTPNGIQQSPAYQSTQNGFVERFSNTGTTLVYATYLTGAAGDTTPAAIAADATDATYLAGFTSATGLPTIAALVPAALWNPSGFLTKLTPLGDGITFSTFIPGAGLTSLALDSTGQTLLATGAVALGQFPVDTVATPLVPTTYQVLLRLPLDGQSVTSSTVLAPGTQSNVAAGPSGTAWVDGTFAAAPLLPLAPLADTGNGYALRVNAQAVVDQAARFGGNATSNPTYASLPTTLTSIAVAPTGEPLIAGAIQPTASSSLLATETYDLPLRNAPTSAFPSTPADAALTKATCTGSLCAGSAAYLSKLTPTAAPALSFSAGDLPFVLLRNLGSVEADNLTLATTAGTLTTNCGTTLYPGTTCNLLLSGGVAGSLTATSSNGGTQSTSYPAYAPPASTIAFYPRELDFGIATSVSPAPTRTFTVTNLGTTSQTFAYAGFAPFSQSATDCTLSGANKVLGPGGTCHITLAFTAGTTDGFQSGSWTIGTRTATLTGYSQAAALSVSAAEIDFGTQYTNGLRLPRYLYLSNASATPQSHATLTLAKTSPFTLTDACPATLPAASVCRIRIDYQSAAQTSTDSINLTLDGGLTVLLTGQTLPPKSAGGATVNPSLSVTPTAITYAGTTPVTGISATQTASITNAGPTPFSLSLALTGDFYSTTSCTATLAAGATCAVAITFAPSQPGTRSGLLAVTAGSGYTPAYVTLTGTATAILAATNGNLDFGAIPTGEPVTQYYKISQPFTTLTATATGPYTVTLVEDTGFGHGTPSAGSFAATYTGSCHNCYLAVRFLPPANGPQPGTLTLSSAPTGTPYALTLTGSGTALTGLVLTPAAQDFGSVPLHSTGGTVLFTLTNLSASQGPVTLAAPVLTGDFVQSTISTGTQACAGTLAYGAACQLLVAFAPTATGTRTGTGTLTISAGSQNAVANLSGTGASDPGFALKSTVLTFSATPDVNSRQQTVTLTNTSSLVETIGTPTTGTSAFTAGSACTTLAPASSCTLTVTFTPAAATVTDSLTIPISTTLNGATTTANATVVLNGAYTSTSAGLQIAPGQAIFGPIATGTQSSTRTFTINNLTAKSLALSINIPRQFTLTGTPCTALAPNGSCTFTVAFVPLTNGDIPGTLYAQATPNDGTPALNGIGYVEGFGVGSGTLTITGALISNNTYSFGQVTSGQTASQIFTLANRNPQGSPAITVRRVTSGPPFLSSSTCGTPLNVGDSCTVTVAYAPSNQVVAGTSSPAATTDSGSLTIESDAASSPDVLTLSGFAGPVTVTTPNDTVALATYTLSQNSLSFGSTSSGNVSAPQTVTLTNTGTAALHVAGVGTSADFTATSNCATVAPGATCTLTVTLTPQTAGVKYAALEIASDSSTSLEFVSLNGTGTPSPLTLSATNLNFGSVLVGATATLPLQLTNSGSAPITFQAVNATGDYTVSGTCPASGGALASGASCMLRVSFTPTAAGTRTGNVSITTTATTNPLLVPLTGVGLVSQLAISPASLNFGSVVTGASASLTLTLANTGTVPITSLAVVATGDFAVTQPCPSTTLAAGSSCFVQITFTPTATGVRSGTLVITSSDPGSPANVPLTGTGILAGAFTLTVDGGAVSSATVTSGQPASYRVTVTPTGNFTGSVALTCAPVVVAQYAACSILPGSVTLAGQPQTATVTITTVTSTSVGSIILPAHLKGNAAFFCLLIPGVITVWRARRRLRRKLPVLCSLVLVAVLLLVVGCGHTSQTDASLRYTPAGTYQYTVTASSTSGVPVTQTVTLNLVVTAR